MMRVLYIGSGNLFGGVEVLHLHLARHHRLCPSMEPQFALCFEGKESEQLRKCGAEVHLLGKVRFSRPWTVWRARRQLRKVLRQMSFDVAICHECWVHSLFAPVIRRHGLPLVFWTHDAHYGKKNWMENLARRTPPDLALCNSRYTQESISSLYPSAKSELLYAPISTPEEGETGEKPNELRQRFGTSVEDVVIVQVGRWEACKGHSVHVEALGSMSQLPGWVCWQVGGTQRPAEEEYLRSIRAMAVRKGVANRIRFIGWQLPSTVREILTAADIYCQPNTLPEAFGRTFIEAMYAGLPVVTTAIGGPKEFVSDTCGLLVPPNDVPALARALTRLVREPKTRIQLGEAGPPRARALCDPQQQLQLLYGHLTKVVASHEAN